MLAFLLHTQRTSHSASACIASCSLSATSTQRAEHKSPQSRKIDANDTAKSLTRSRGARSGSEARDPTSAPPQAGCTGESQSHHLRPKAWQHHRTAQRQPRTLKTSRASSLGAWRRLRRMSWSCTPILPLRASRVVVLRAAR
eukprot:3564640-Rhodomonas_salina.3